MEQHLIQDDNRATAGGGPDILGVRASTIPEVQPTEDCGTPAASTQSIADLLAYPGAGDIEFDPPRMNLVLKPADFS